MKRTTWTLIIASLLTAGLGLHLIVTQPLHRQVSRLTAEVDGMQAGMRHLADFRDEIAGTNDLLSKLEEQTRRIEQARADMESLRILEREIRIQTAAAEEALAGIATISKMHGEVIALTERMPQLHETVGQFLHFQRRAERMAASATRSIADIEQAEQSVRQLRDFHRQVAVESSGIEVAENRFGRLIDLKESLENVPPQTIDTARSSIAALDAIAEQVIADGRQAEEAHEITGQLIALQDEIVSRATRVGVARKHTEQLLNLEDTLANDAGRDIDAAAGNLAALLQMEEQLAARDQQLVAAIEALELLEDLQAEFAERTRDLDSIRRGLTEIIAMESMVARTVRSLQPLTELANLRRLDSDQLRSIARSMLESGPHRLAAQDGSTAAVSAPATRNEVEMSPTEESLVPVPPAK